MSRGGKVLEGTLNSTVLNNGVEVFLIPTPKFKTVTVNLFLHQTLNRATATETALIPSVLERGSKELPTSLKIRRKLEGLYGARLDSDILKKGERQLIVFSLDLIHDRFTGEGGSLLEKGLSILKSIVANPLVEGKGFKSAYVNQEKEQLAREIRGLINDKMSYAVERCVQEMCAEENFGVYKYGRLEDLASITPEGCYAYYRDLINHNPLQLYIVGDLEPEKVFSLLEEIFAFERGQGRELSPVDVYHKVKEPRYVEERLAVNQGKLTLGFRTGTHYSDDDFFALLFYNGILGGFPHSKLFQNVREKASLAYFAFSRLERHKGILMISSGIEVKNYERALSIINKQVEQMARGEIDLEEMENTRRGLVNQLRVLEDNPYQLINYYLDGYIGGRGDTLEEFLQKIEQVTKDDVVRVAEKIKLDTVYFLRNNQDSNGEGDHLKGGEADA
ncbi:MAG: EF-P 5-aminopentanol modification-associated protein YfmF [Dethiobacteria bacterium]|jgi:predicted Zn-dependent peptidase|nr:insulinase family protein [Bacillota bacterium]